METNSFYNLYIKRSNAAQSPYINSRTGDVVDAIFNLIKDMELSFQILKDFILEFRISECERIVTDLADAYSAIEKTLDKIRNFFNEERLMVESAWLMVALAVIKQCCEEREYARMYEVIVRSGEPAFNEWKDEIHRVLAKNVSM